MPAPITLRDRSILQRLAERKARAAADPVNVERRNAWLAHDDPTATSRPMILAETYGCEADIPGLSRPTLECEGPEARGLEYALRHELWRFDVLRDDHVVEPFLNTTWKVAISNHGVAIPTQLGDNDGKLGSRHWDPPIKDLDRDMALLKPRTFTVDREGTWRRKAELEALVGDVLPVRIRGSQWWTAGLTTEIVSLHGMDSLMLSMYDNPAGVHRLMAFLRDDFLAFVDWQEREGVLTLNNENDYVGSGTEGYTRRLPQPGRQPGAPILADDLWVLLESQPTVGVGPDQHAEFILPYHQAIAERFGRTYYGCCEGLHTLMPVIRRLPHLARVSVSPWADQEAMAAFCGRELAYCRKPNPTSISTERFDEEAIRRDLRHTLTVARDCRLELVMKDVHTLSGEGDRLARWVQLAREEVAGRRLSASSAV